jgi:hypothetical protein
MSETPDKIFHIDEHNDDQTMPNFTNSVSQIQSISDYLSLNSIQLTQSQLVIDYLNQNPSDQFDYGDELMPNQSSNYIDNRVIILHYLILI